MYQANSEIQKSLTRKWTLSRAKPRTVRQGLSEGSTTARSLTRRPVGCQDRILDVFSTEKWVMFLSNRSLAIANSSAADERFFQIVIKTVHRSFCPLRKETVTWTSAELVHSSLRTCVSREVLNRRLRGTRVKSRAIQVEATRQTRITVTQLWRHWSRSQVIQFSNPK
jgi:hypothetical protein